MSTRETDEIDTAAYYDVFWRDVAARSARRDWTRALDEFVGRLSPGSRVLDIGCGTGSHLPLLAERGLSPEGADPSKQMRRIARRTGYPIHDCRFESLATLGRARYRGLWSAASLLHVEQRDAPAALHGAHFVLAPGSIFYLTTREGAVLEEDSFDAPGGPVRRRIQLYGLDELMHLLNDAGFSMLSTWKEASTWGRPTSWISVIAAAQ